jgi:ElaA protein
MEASIQAIKEHYNETDIKISAQCYLNKFYNNLGFKAIGEDYLEDGIPHIAMVYKV